MITERFISISGRIEHPADNDGRVCADSLIDSVFVVVVAGVMTALAPLMFFAAASEGDVVRCWIPARCRQVRRGGVVRLARRSGEENYDLSVVEVFRFQSD